MQDWQEVLQAAGFPENALVLDFETYWSKDYTLKKLSMVEFIADDRFELTGLAAYSLPDPTDNIVCGGQGLEYLTGAEFVAPDETYDFLCGLKEVYGEGLADLTVVAQNANFDCLILREHFGIMPKYIVDTQDLDKMWDARSKHNLKVMAEKWGAPAAKGDTVQSLGLHWNDMTEEQRSAWAEYARTDAEIEAWLFKKMLPIVVSRPEIELPVANLTHQMYLNPTFQIDMALGQKIIDGMRAEMLAPIDRLRRRGVKPAAGKKTLEESIGGSISFVTMLMEALPEGESVPLKAGKPTKNMIPLTGVGMIPALAKDDQGMHELLQHPKMSVRRLAEAKQSLQSWPLHISKVDSIMKQAACRDGFIGTPLGYHNARTGRWGGIEGINLQNLGGAGRGGKGTHPLIKEVRHMLVAPKGYVLGIQDYSKVEAVGVAWQAGQRDLLEGFRTGSDVYSDLAADLFGHEVRESTEDDAPDVALQLDIERGFGKDCILGAGYGLGASTFYDRCYANELLKPKFDDGTFDMRFIEQVIQTYRRKYSRVPVYWKRLENEWRWVTKYPFETRRIPECGLEFFNKDGATFIRLPSERTIRYPHAQVDREDGKLRYHWGHLWGGALTENVVQALCRDFIAESLLRLQDHGFWCVLTVHDEIVAFLPEKNAESRLKEMGELMTIVPSWARGFPLRVKGKISERYCK